MESRSHFKQRTHSPTNLSEPEDSMPLDADPFDDEDMYSVDYNDEAISIGSDSDHFIFERSDSDVSDLGGSNSDGESQHLSEIMVERLQNDLENIFVMAKALCDSQGIVLFSSDKELKGFNQQVGSDNSICEYAISETEQ
ncbi:hypothetical protein EDB84DRAFT_1443130 [Lactarius hengduanensis]|nr:hypothetical protein EDB84DRAFT_1443487 [Lactarius hengduanensis]KAH9016366.1 hypothetical protein EDB84DRAFT_1443130 [Lactarius hengduanensis]